MLAWGHHYKQEMFKEVNFNSLEHFLIFKTNFKNGYIETKSCDMVFSTPIKTIKI